MFGRPYQFLFWNCMGSLKLFTVNGTITLEYGPKRKLGQSGKQFYQPEFWLCGYHHMILSFLSIFMQNKVFFDARL